MENFTIVRALARSALAHSNPAIRKQVERLRDALTSEGDEVAAASLEELLAQDSRTLEMAPSRIVRSVAALQGGELLTANTPVPVDRETSTPLAEVLFAEKLPPSPPILDEELALAVEGIVEEWRNAAVLSDAGLSAIRSLLIYGAPGTGKTHLALWMASELQLPVVMARLDGLVSSFLGTSSRNIGALFAFASRYKCVLLLDEFDAVAKLRDDPNEMGEIKRVVNTLLQNLDARTTVGFTIGITNHEQLLDPAVWRRFEGQLAVPSPSFSARMAIARFYLDTMEVGDAGVRLLAWLTEGSSGADIQQLCRSLAKRLILDSDHEPVDPFMTTLKGLLPTHAGRLSPDRLTATRRPVEDLVPLLLEDRELGMSRLDAAQLVGRDPSTVSRWIQRANSLSPTRWSDDA